MGKLSKLLPAQKSAQQLANEIAAAKALREALATMTDDAEVIRDTIEGETDLHEAIAKVDEFILSDESLAAGIQRMQESLAARKERIDKRIAFYRTCIEQAMLIGEINTKMELPTGTISLRTVPAKLEVTDEAAIPAVYWRQPDPTLDKKAVLDALKAHRDAVAAAEGDGTEPPPAPFAGATLTAEGVTLAIRRA